MKIAISGSFVSKNTEKIYNGLVRLPLYPSLSKLEIKNIINATQKFLKRI